MNLDLIANTLSHRIMENEILIRGMGRLDIKFDEPNLRQRPEGRESDTTARLPPELLGAIYELGNTFEERSERFKTHFPLVVSQVSARWRNIALNTPSLWKDIFLQANMVTATELVEAYLERSRNCLLDIDLDLDNCMTAEAWADRIECQLDRIVEHIGRWRHLAVHGTWRPSFLTFTGRLRNSYAPFLESVVICWNVPNEDADEDEDTVPCTNVLAGGSPRLSTLFLNEVNLTLFLPPLSSITSFTLGSSCDGYPVSFRVFRHALMHMPHLRQLFVDVNNVELLEGSMPVEIPSLVYLEIALSVDTPSDVPALLSLVHTPGIESLLLEELLDEDIPLLANFFRLSHVSRKYPLLRSLELRNIRGPLSRSQAAELFTAIPSVVHVSFTDSIWFVQRGEYNSSLESLSTDMLRGDMLWPNLCSITLTSFVDGDISLLRAVISNRIRERRPILFLIIPKPSGAADNQQDLEWLQQHVQVIFVQNPVHVTWLSCSARGMHAFDYRRC